MIYPNTKEWNTFFKKNAQECIRILTNDLKITFEEYKKRFFNFSKITKETYHLFLVRTSDEIKRLKEKYDIL